MRRQEKTRIAKRFEKLAVTGLISNKSFISNLFKRGYHNIVIASFGILCTEYNSKEECNTLLFLTSKHEQLVRVPCPAGSLI